MFESSSNQKKTSVVYLSSFNKSNFTGEKFLNNKPYFYECMLVDVGGIKHSVESVPYARLIFKLAIREPWDKIYNALKNKGWIDPDLTMCINPNLKEYISIAPTKENELWEYLPPNDMRRK